ncbi:MAG TPA: tRNA epoxyqueuosine(34) reductase QueG, partial [Longimicrobiales bacterium]|nr:tRNA epoxyqueuosine(34) reductase QueG [Longimicrobiales bacterium]
MTRGGAPVPAKEAIREEALRLGFSSCGFAPAATPLHADAYLEWLRRARHGEMAWMAREDAVRRRLDPREALAGCQTLIVVAWSYAPGIPAGPLPERGAARAEGSGAGDGPRSFATPPDRDPARSAGDAVIARYALGRDYHDLFEERLGLLSDAVREHAPDAACKLYVDYGPVLERDHAQRAGLGWIGKNTMLIHPDVGSYFLLGELITDLDLPPDDPFLPDRCGTCDRCIVACPTDAIVGPRELDARRCISYLTIELRGPIPVELRPAIGDRVFGCDI